MALKPTSEQTDFLDATATGDDTALIALAGTGKTSSLNLDARARINIPMCYVAFNKSTADDAQRRFPRNVTARTAHGFAYQYVMKSRTGLKDRLANQTRVPRWRVVQILRLPSQFSFGNLRLRDGQLAGLVNEAVGRFCSSAEPLPLPRHIPKVPGMTLPDARRALEEFLFPYVIKAWEDLISDNGQLRFTHDCQPAGTMVRVASFSAGGGMGVGGSRTEWVDVPIEQVREGDRVVSWTGGSRMGYVRRAGRRVNAVGSRAFSGQLIDIETERGRRTSCTPEHICVARFDSDLTDGNYVVYLARRGSHFRVGRTTWRTLSQANTNGLRRRAASQGADAMWVLSVHATDTEAALAEAATAYRFNIPTWQFRSTNEIMPLERFWALVGDNSAVAKDCLEAFGRDARFPLWAPGTEADWASLRRPLFVRACNLLSGMLVCEPDEIKPGPNNALFCNDGSGAWSIASVSRRDFEGDVYFLDVDVDHTYVADGIVTHNCYLKLASMDPGFRLPGEVVLLDEAQDADPVVMHIVRRMQLEHGAQIVTVGDNNQQIYEWRGAIDALAQFDVKHRLPLTQSFRFGPEIAEEANRILSLLPTDLRVRGLESLDSKLAVLDDPDTILCRTNAEAVARLLVAQVNGVSAGLVGGTQAVEWLAKAALDLSEGRPTDHPELRAFDTWSQVQQYADEEKDARDLQVLVRLVDRHGPDTLLEAVERAVPEQQAKLLISTAHKAKGREWARVMLASDFEAPLGGDDGEQLLEGELRLAYVAVTRAKDYLDSRILTPWLGELVDPRLMRTRELIPTAEVAPRQRERVTIEVAQVMCDPESEHRVMMTGTKYDPDLVAAQRELPSDMRPSYRGEYCGFEKVRIVNAGWKVMQLVEKFGLTITDSARERIMNYS